MGERHDVVVVGAGQAGLAASYELTRRGVEHVVLERGQIAQSWRDRWDSFCLVTPNWSVQPPGGAYDGPDPDGYMPRDEIAAFFERYASAFDAPVRTGVTVRTLTPVDDTFEIGTDDGTLVARDVIVASGTYARSHRPPGAEMLPTSVTQLDVADYRNPDAVPDGDVLVVGNGQSGCQIAEELLESGREVVLACGRAPWVYRTISGRDVVWWGANNGFLEQPVGSLPSEEARLFANLQASGHGGGHDLTTRTLRDNGVTLVGRFLGVDGSDVVFGDDLGASMAWGDARHRDFMALCERLAEARGLEYDPPLPPSPFDGSSPTTMPLERFAVVLFAGGFRPNYAEWVDVPDAFDPVGFPVHVDGASTVAPGLFFLGTHFLRKRKSSLLIGVGEDAAIVADAVGARLDGKGSQG